VNGDGVRGRVKLGGVPIFGWKDQATRRSAAQEIGGLGNVNELDVIGGRAAAFPDNAGLGEFDGGDARSGLNLRMEGAPEIGGDHPGTGKGKGGRRKTNQAGHCRGAEHKAPRGEGLGAAAQREPEGKARKRRQGVVQQLGRKEGEHHKNNRGLSQ